MQMSRKGLETEAITEKRLATNPTLSVYINDHQISAEIHANLITKMEKITIDVRETTLPHMRRIIFYLRTKN